MQNRIQNARLQLYLILPVFICLLAGFRILLPELPSSPLMKEAFWASKINAESDYDIVYTGDSRVYRGIDPSVVDSLCGGKGFNFGFSSAGLDSLLLYRSASLLRNEGRRILLIGVSANAFLPSSLRNEHLKMWLKRSESDLLIKRKIYPHIRYFDPYFISDIFKHLKGEAYRESFHVQTGFVASDRIPSDSSSAILAYLDQFEREKYDTAAVRTFLKICAHMNQSGIRVILTRIPSTFDMRDIEDVATGFLCDRIFAEAESAGIEVLKQIKGSYRSYDGSHLEYSSAHRFSVVLGQYLAENQ